MPEISRFFGIIIAMYYNDHGPAHLHVRYGSERALMAIDGRTLLDGRLSPRVLGLVVEWAAGHREELLEDWKRSRKQGAIKFSIVSPNSAVSNHVIVLPTDRGPHAGQKHLHRHFIIADVLPGPLFGELPEFLLASGGNQKGRYRRALPVERRRMPAARRRIPRLDFRLSLGQHARQRARVGRRAGKSDNRRQYKRHGHLRGAA